LVLYWNAFFIFHASMDRPQVATDTLITSCLRMTRGASPRLSL
jgi:hypothetical protein